MTEPRGRLLRDPERRRASVKAAIAALPAAGRTAGSRKVETDYPDAAYLLLRRCALEREIAVASYIRRATYAMMAHDLGVAVTDLLADDPRVQRYTGAVISDAEGVKFGSWQIEGLVDDGGRAED